MAGLALAFVAFALSGCYLSHGRDDVADAGRADGGRLDAGVVADAGLPPGSCRSADPAIACVAGETRPFLASGTASELVIATDDCHCGGTLRCSAAVARPASATTAGALDVRTEVCDEGRCSACTEPFEVTCPIPALLAGRYEVRVNDRGPTFDLWAMDGPGVSPTTLCATVGSTGGGLCDFPGDLTAWRPDRICYADRSRGDRVVLELEADDTSCAYEPGPCDVYALLTPEGGNLEVRPRVRNCDEGSSTWGCTGPSGTLRRPCGMLALPPGVYTMVLQDGTSLGTIEITDGDATPARCHPVP